MSLCNSDPSNFIGNGYGCVGPSAQWGDHRGVKFLLNFQLEDGSWHVKTRTRPVQPYFDSYFPRGSDQFISAAATSWATMALAAAK